MAFVNIEKRSSSGRPSPLFYRPEDFRVGDVVRLFLAYATSQDIRVRQGKVLDVMKQKRDEPALQLSVSAVGAVWREEPREVKVMNAYGYWVRGHPHMVPQERSFKAIYLYDCISLVQRLES